MNKGIWEGRRRREGGRKEEEGRKGGSCHVEIYCERGVDPFIKCTLCREVIEGRVCYPCYPMLLC